MSVLHTLVALAATPLPSPTSTPGELDASTVSPGVLGFLVTFAVAVATVGLGVSMTRHVRRARHRAGVAGSAGVDQPPVP